MCLSSRQRFCFEICWEIYQNMRGAPYCFFCLIAWRCLMAANEHQTYIYVGLAGEGQYIAEGGLYRYAESTGAWQSMTQGLPPTPQVRALLMHPDNPAVLYAGTQCGPYRSDDRGEHWAALEAPREGRDV